MLQEIMEHLNNYFVPISAKQVTYTISGGVISPSFGAENGDRFLICGSRRNDGVYTWHADGIKNDDDTEVAGLCDETFAGTIRVCAVPPAVLALSREKSQWEEAHSGELNSPLASESFNGYSYSLKTGKNGEALTWYDTPSGKVLERWRRPFV
jgi:hypothetical protein